MANLARIDVDCEAAPLTFGALSHLLLLSAGIIQRKIDINWNLDDRVLSSWPFATYSRALVSGGGLYPCELYPVMGRGAPVSSGIYHYDAAHHALEKLQAGSASHQVQESMLGQWLMSNTTNFILIAVNFSKNTFKYHNFSYQVVTQDVGAVAAMIRLGARSLGIKCTCSFWYRDSALNQLLGLDSNFESVFGVVGLARANARTPAPRTGVRAAKADHPVVELRGSALQSRESFRRSRSALRLPMVEEVHAAAFLEDEGLPEPSQIVRAACACPCEKERVSIPSPNYELLGAALSRAALSRRSSWGKMTSRPELSGQSLATLLHWQSLRVHYSADVNYSASEGPLTRLMLFVNHVENLDAGSYSYDHNGHFLRIVKQGDFALKLQQSYFLQNYNLEQASVVLAIVGRPERMLEAFGNRGLRILNGEVGMRAQMLYLGASALGLGCGALLGYDNVALNQLLGLDVSDETVLLMVLAGTERVGLAGFDYYIASEQTRR